MSLASSLLLLFSITSALIFLLYRQKCKRDEAEYKAALNELHRQAWEGFIKDLNHNGAIPLGASAQGVYGLVTSRFLVVCRRLEEKMEAGDPNTESESTEIKDILRSEFALGYLTLDEALTGIRTTLKTYSHKQYPQ